MSYIETADLRFTEVKPLGIWSEGELKEAVEAETQFLVPIDLVGTLRAQLVAFDVATKVGVFEVTDEDQREFLWECYEVPLESVGCELSVKPSEFGIAHKGA